MAIFRIWKIPQSVWQSVLESGIMHNGILLLHHVHYISYISLWICSSIRCVYALEQHCIFSVRRGFVRVKKQVYLIEPLTNHTDGDHALYKHQHLRWKRSSCGEPNTSIYDHEPPVAVPLMSSRQVITSSGTLLVNVLCIKKLYIDSKILIYSLRKWSVFTLQDLWNCFLLSITLR